MIAIPRAEIPGYRPAYSAADAAYDRSTENRATVTDVGHMAALLDAAEQERDRLSAIVSSVALSPEDSAALIATLDARCSPAEAAQRARDAEAYVHAMTIPKGYAPRRRR